MEKYIVIEMQTSAQGAVGTLVTAYDSYNLAQQKYHTVLAAAAVSQLAIHSAAILSPYGELIEGKAYRRDTQIGGAE